MKTKKLVIVGVSIILITSLLLSGWVYFSLLKYPVDGHPYYYRNRLGEVYVTNSEGCLDICIIQSFEKIDVDIKSFEVLKEKSGFSTEYAKDKNFVYWEAKIIERADTNTFKLISWGMAKDNNSYYMRGIPLLEYILSIDSTIDIKHNSEIELLEFTPTKYFKIKADSGVYTIYYVGDKRVEKN